MNHIATLGGDNNFIEIQKGTDGYVWIMVHSGSRNIGFFFLFSAISSFVLPLGLKGVAVKLTSSLIPVLTINL